MLINVIKQLFPKIKSQNGQSMVEYIIMVAVIIFVFLGIKIFPGQKAPGLIGMFQTAIDSYLEAIYFILSLPIP